MKLKDEEIYTETQLLQKKREEEVVRLFKELAKPCLTVKKVSPERLMAVIADKTQLTILGVKGILKRHGLYESNAKLKEQFAAE